MTETDTAPQSQGSVWRRFKATLFFDLLRTQKRAFLWFLAAPLFLGPTAALTAQIQSQMVDRGIIAQVAPLEPYLKAFVILSLLSIIGSFATNFLGLRIIYCVEYDLRMRVYRAIQSAELRRLDRVATGQLVTRSLSDVGTITQSIQILPAIIFLIPLCGGLLTYLAFKSPLMALVAVLPLPINVWILRKFSPRFRALSWAELNERAEVAQSIDEPVKGIRVVKSFGREDFERGRVRDAALRAYRFAMSRWRLLARYDIAMKAGPWICTAGLVAIGARLVVQDQLSVGSYLVTIQLGSLMAQLGSQFDQGASAFQYINTSQNRIAEVLRMGEEGERSGLPLPPSSHGVLLEQVTVEIGGRRVLDGVDLEARPGEITAVVGAPGAGKSTLAAVIAGLLSPDTGSAILDDAVLTDIHPDELYDAIKIVSEDSFLFAGSVRENLELGLHGPATDAELSAALRAAGADDFIDDLPQGIETPMGDRGLTVSGGQRQRIALARAVITKPRVLVLDDGLSAVNPSLEVEILGRLREFLPKSAIVAISRRTAGSTLADRLVELPAPEPIEGALSDTSVPVVALAEGSMAPAVLQTLSGFRIRDEDPGAPEEFLTKDAPMGGRELGRVFRRPLTIAVCGLTAWTLVQASPELLTGNMTDLAEKGDTGAIWLRCLILLLLGVFGIAGAYLTTVHGQRLAQGIMYTGRRRLFQRLSKLGIDHYDRELPGQVAARVIYDLDVINRFFQQWAFLSLGQIAKMLVGFGFIIILAPKVGLVVIAGALVIYIAGRLQTPITRGALNRARDQLGTVVTAFEEDCAGRLDIRAFGARPRQETQFAELSTTLKLRRRAATIQQALMGAIIGQLGQILGAVVLFTAGGVVLAGGISLGTALTVRLLAASAAGGILFLSTVYTQLLDVRVSWDRLKQPFYVPVLPAMNPMALPVGRLEGDIALDQVSFSYPHTGRQILHDVTIHLKPGQVTALVGATGSGKSSIAKLVSRTYDPDHGRLVIDGHDLRELDYDSYRSHIAVVPQDAFLFRGTIRSNIAYGRPGATDQEIEAASRAVGAHRMLAALPHGYGHRVEEEARNLSAAQRQLIALARAWIAEPEILILDEATSCLDARLEQEVLDGVTTLGCTTLTVTHRQHVAAAADHIIVLQDGEVVEQGSPAELQGAGGAYDRLWVEVLGMEAPVAPVGSVGRRAAKVVVR